MGNVSEHFCWENVKGEKSLGNPMREVKLILKWYWRV
jgi:hypothetical protein